MSDTDPQRQDVSTPSQTPETPPVPEQPAAVPDEAQNPEQYFNLSSRVRDPKDIQKK